MLMTGILHSAGQIQTPREFISLLSQKSLDDLLNYLQVFDLQ